MDGEPYKSVDIDIQGPGFLEVGSTFSVSLRDVQYLGPGGMSFLYIHIKCCLLYLSPDIYTLL